MEIPQAGSGKIIFHFLKTVKINPNIYRFGWHDGREFCQRRKQLSGKKVCTNTLMLKFGGGYQVGSDSTMNT